MNLSLLEANRFRWRHQYGMSESEILSLLPSSLAGEIKFALIERCLRNVDCIKLEREEGTLTRTKNVDNTIKPKMEDLGKQDTLSDTLLSGPSNSMSRDNLNKANLFTPCLFPPSLLLQLAHESQPESFAQGKQ